MSYESDPSGSSYRHVNSSENEEKLVEAKIQKLESKQVITEVQSEPGEFVSTIFLTKKRWQPPDDIKIKCLDKSVEKIPFKMDTLKTAIALLKEDCFFASLDVRDAYYSIPIDRGFR